MIAVPGVLAVQLTTADIAMAVAIFVLILISILTAAAETALVRISRAKASALAEEGRPGGAALVYLVEQPERWLNALLLVVLVCQIVQASLTGVLAGNLFGGWGVIIATGLNVSVMYVLAETAPKTWAIQHTERAALGAARPVKWLADFAPLRGLAKFFIVITNVILPGKGLKEGPYVSEEELLAVAAEAHESAAIDKDERQLIESIIEFGDTVAREIMVPRPDIVVVEHDCTVSQALDIALREGYSRLPVVNSDDDDVLGLAFAKDMMRTEREGGGQQPVTELLRSVHFVPENKPVNRLMREMQADKFHLALVADEYGAFAGLVTLEDCLEELVGEIVDEHDDEDAEVQRLADGAYLFDGGMSVDDVNDLLGTSIPDDDWDTISGFLFGTLEHLPAIGEAIVHDGWRFAAAEMEGRRIRHVKVTLEREPGESGHA